MLDTKLLRNDLEAIRKSLLIKGFDLDADRFLTLEAQRKLLQEKTETLQNLRNTRSKEIGKAKASGQDIAPLIAEIGDLGEQLDSAKANFSVLQNELTGFLSAIPNLPHEDVPEGKLEEHNVELEKWGSIPEFNFSAKDHVDLGMPDSLDFDAAAQMSGARFVVIHHHLARLQRALTQYMLDTHTEIHQYREVYVPYLVGPEALFGTGQLPKFADDQFKIAGERELYLIPTAEVPVTNLYRDTILKLEELPIRHVCHTPCFRSEAGSYGRDTKGMIRQHQFEKVELVQLVNPSESWNALDELTSHAEAILKGLELPYRRMLLCGGDLGFSSAKTLDLEVWLPGQQAYREISSCSNFLDFQSRRVQARYRASDSKQTNHVHTLNGSGLAVGRALVAVMENYQDGHGRIHVPDVLRKYMGDITQIDLRD
ncbi:MAG: serine--tRNA ligase [Pseudomonadales bacterium]|nr:serine--tRNA ligase [Pseudomonadales bacterium]